MVDHTDDLTQHEQSFRLRHRMPGLTARLTRRARRVCLAGVTFLITIILFVAIAFGLLSLRLSHGPIAVTALDGPVLSALESRMQPGLRVAIDGVDVEAVDGRPAISLKQLSIRDQAGKTIFRAPRAVIAVDPLKLFAGVITPTRLDVRDLVLKLSILADGSAALSAGTEDTAPLRVSDAVALLTGSPSASSASETASLPQGGLDEQIADSKPSTNPSRTPMAQFAASLAGMIDLFSDGDRGVGGLDRFGVDQGTLILDDRTHDTVTTFRNLDVAFQRTSVSSSTLSVAADGADGRWSIQILGAQQPDRRRALSIEAEGITLDDLKALPDFRETGFDTDMPLNARLTLGLDQAGGLSVFRGRVATGGGFFRVHDPDYEPLFVDAMETEFHFDSGRNAIVVSSATLKADTSSYHLAGQIMPPAIQDQPWAIAVSGQGTFGAERPGEKPIPLEQINIQARVAPGQGSVSVDAFRIAGPQVDLNLQFAFQKSGTGTSVKGGATAGRMPAPAMLRIWPTAVAADVRTWLLVNLQGGMIERGTVNFDLDDADLAKMRALRSVADGHLRVDYAVSDVTLAFMDGVPPLRKVKGRGTVTGDTSQFAVDSGVIDVSAGHELAVADGSLSVPSTDLKPSPATIAVRVVGGVDSLTELLSRDALKPYADLPADIGSAHGQIDGSLLVGLKIGRGANPKDVKTSATAQVTGLTIEKLVGKQNLTDGQIGLVLDKAGLKIKGDARLFGAQTAIDVKKPAGTAGGEANVVLTMDDAARVKAGFNLGRQLTGPLVAKVSVALGGSDHKPATVDVDLSKAAINNLLPGLFKPVGKPGRVTLTVNPSSNGVTLDNVSCDIGAFAVRGSASLDADGGFQSAHLSQVRLSPGDDMKVEATQGPDALKLVIRGANIDARPFLKDLTGSDSSPSSGSSGKDIDLDLHASVLTGQNSQALTSVDLRMAKRDGQMRRLQLSGKFGRAPFEIRSSQQGRDLVLDATSADAGATLTFLDLYKKVNGGKLDATIHMAEGKFDGYATIHEFALREDQAMKRLTEEGISQEKKNDFQIDTSNISFTKLYVLFTKVGTRMNIRDGGMFGPQMGATVQGWIDLGGDRLQLNGTYVPAYGVNNLFSQIPVFGPLLGGGSHEGLFGINYKLTGSVVSPNLTVDPLSALAPGFLRKIFGAISEATQEGGAPTVKKQDFVPDTVAR